MKTYGLGIFTKLCAPCSVSLCCFRYKERILSDKETFHALNATIGFYSGGFYFDYNFYKGNVMWEFAKEHPFWTLFGIWCFIGFVLDCWESLIGGGSGSGGYDVDAEVLSANRRAQADYDRRIDDHRRNSGQR